MRKRLIGFVANHILYFGGILILVILLARNPFSIRTLIPNLEPFPDSFHYIVPARSFLNGKGFVFEREGRTFRPSVPPLYSATMVPAFALHEDPRMFYFSNVVLAAITFTLFYLICRHLFPHTLVQAALVLFYVTNFYTTWYPQWAMAENLTMTLVLSAVYLFVRSPSAMNAVISGALPVTLYATKYAHGPLAVMISMGMVGKYAAILLSRRTKKSWQLFTFVVIACVIGFSSYLYSEYITTGSNILLTVFEMAKQYFSEVQVRVSDPASAGGGTGFFSLGYFRENFIRHWVALHGGWTHVLWDFTPLLITPLAAPGLLGLWSAWMHKRYRALSFFLLFLIFGQVTFMSTFYAFDMRYVLYSFPFLLLGLGMLFEFVWERVKIVPHWRAMWRIGLLLGCVVYVFSQMPRLRLQLALNLKYAETPWWHISVNRTINFLEEKYGTAPVPQPLLISAIPPFMYDFYSHGGIELLPLSKNQEFRAFMKQTWGDRDYTDLLELYSTYVRDGRDLYIMNYGLGNEKILNDAYQDVKDTFRLELMEEGCYSLCNIYKVYSLEK